MISEILSHIHPIIVHFPIALIVVGFAFDVVRLFRRQSFSPTAGLWLWIIALVGAIAAHITGPGHDARGITPLIHTHSSFADYTVWATIIVVVIRLIMWRVRSKKSMAGVVLTVYMLFSLLSVGFVLATGYYGGAMVYDQGVGVKINGHYVNPPHSVPHK